MEPYVYKCVIDRVVDGDTIDVIIDLGFHIYHKARVRMLDYDAPETWRPSSEEERVLGEAATAHLVGLIGEGKTYLIQTKLDRTDLYGRVLGRLIANGVDVNQMMVEFCANQPDAG